MIPYERQQRILQILASKDLVFLEELQHKIPNVSSSTLRRDIKELERTGKVEHLQGGAIKATTTAEELPTSVKSSLQTTQKTAIAHLAEQLVGDKETVYVDSGTTCTALLLELLSRNVSIVTSNTDAVRLVTSPTRARITLLGGTYDPRIASLSGPLTEEAIGRYIFAKAFIGANGIDERFGITTPSLEEANKKKAVAARAQKTYVLADSSKFHQVSAVQTLGLSDVTIISDATDDALAALTELVCP